MRPNRIGAIPTRSTPGGTAAALATGKRVELSSTTANGARTGRWTYELVPVEGSFIGNVGSTHAHVYVDNAASNADPTTIPLSVGNPRFGIGYFHMPEFVRTTQDAPLPIYMQCSGSAVIPSTTSNMPPTAYPVVGIKRNAELAVNNINSATAKNNRQIYGQAMIPVEQFHSYRAGAIWVNYMAWNTTIMLAQSFTDIGGTGPSSELPIGYGIAITSLGNTNCDILAETAPIIVQLNSWIYTGDIEAVDPYRG